MFADQRRVKDKTAAGVEARALVEWSLVPEARDGRSNVVGAGHTRSGWRGEGGMGDKLADRRQASPTRNATTQSLV